MRANENQGKGTGKLTYNKTSKLVSKNFKIPKNTGDEKQTKRNTDRTVYGVQKSGPRNPDSIRTSRGSDLLVPLPLKLTPNVLDLVLKFQAVIHLQNVSIGEQCGPLLGHLHTLSYVMPIR